MPAITYDELLRTVPLQVMAANRDLIDNMPTIVRQAEEEILEVLDYDAFQSTIPGLTLDPGAAEPDIIDLTAQDPPLLGVRAIRVNLRGRFTPLRRRDPDAMAVLYPLNLQGEPRYYAEDGRVFRYRVFPAPDRVYEVEVFTNEMYAQLSDQQQTNVLTQTYPRVLEAACIYRAAVWMKNPMDIENKQRDFASATSEANLRVTKRRRDETQERGRETSNVDGS